MTSTINASTSSGIVQTADTSGALALQTAGTTAMTINSSQIVSVGSSGSLNSRFNVNDTLAITNSGGGQYILIGNQDSGGVNKPRIINSGNATLTFGTGSSWSSSTGGTLTQQLQIASDGTLLHCYTNNGTLYPAFFARAFAAINAQTRGVFSSGNVSSVTDNGNGTVNVSLTTAMPDSNYAVTTGESGSGVLSGTTVEVQVVSSSLFRLRGVGINATNYYWPYLCCSVFR